MMAIKFHTLTLKRIFYLLESLHLIFGAFIQGTVQTFLETEIVRLMKPLRSQTLLLTKAFTSEFEDKFQSLPF